MKKVQFVSVMLFVMLTSVCFGQDSQTYRKSEHLINFMGMPMYAGWDLMIFYDVNFDGNVVSDTTYHIFTNSAAYTHVQESFTMYSTSNLSELIAFFDFLNDKLELMPQKSSYISNEYSLRVYKGNKMLILTKTDTQRDDYYTYYSLSLYKKINKSLVGLK